MNEILQGKHSINLLQPELIAVKPLWTLKRVIVLWVSILLVMITAVFVNQNQLAKNTSQQNQLKSEEIFLNEKLASLENELSSHKPNNTLKTKITALTAILNNKTYLYAELTDSTKIQVAGFAHSMTELSEKHHKGISLSEIQMNKNNMSFSGITKTPQAVPAWLAGFEHSTFLSGKKFINFVMQENDDKQIQFTVSSTINTKGLKNE